LEHFKVAYDNNAFTLSHCWSILKDSKKWEDSFALWLELENKKGKGNASTGNVIDVDCEGPSTSGLPGAVQ
jgi:hypothetical protein